MEAREIVAARIYCASFKALTDCGVTYDLADEVSRIIERETAIGISYERTEQEQQLVNQALNYLTPNN